jgi:hypothetical protein
MIEIRENVRQALRNGWSLEQDNATVRSLVDGLEATLLFHSSSPWDDTKAARWSELTGSTDATTKALCDFLRSIRA